jgi:hypothetical protein
MKLGGGKRRGQGEFAGPDRQPLLLHKGVLGLLCCAFGPEALGGGEGCGEGTDSAPPWEY